MIWTSPYNFVKLNIKTDYFALLYIFNIYFILKISDLPRAYICFSFETALSNEGDLYHNEGVDVVMWHLHYQLHFLC